MNLARATICRRGGDWINTISLGDSGAKKISRGLIQVDEMISDIEVADLIPSVNSWEGSMTM